MDKWLAGRNKPVVDMPRPEVGDPIYLNGMRFVIDDIRRDPYGNVQITYKKVRSPE